MSLWAFGSSSSGQCGVSTSAARDRARVHPLPVRVRLDLVQAAFTHVAVGDAHCVGCDELGSVYAWGRTREGQCGKVDVVPVERPTLVAELQREAIVHVACGADASFALTASGVLYQWGAVHKPSTALTDAHMVGYGRSDEQLSEQDRLMLKESLASFLAGDDESSDDDGDVAGGGMGGGARDGAQDGTRGGVEASVDVRASGGNKASVHPVVGTRRELRPTAERVSTPPGTRVCAMAAGFGFALLVLEDGGVCSWGLNDRFQCGLGDRVPRDAPTRLPALARVRVHRVACGQ